MSSATSPRPPLPRAAPAGHGHRLAALDGLRGIAVLSVLVLHFSMLHPASAGEHIYSQLVGLGWAGVDLFFVLSGFLITGILLDSRGKPAYFRTFYTRRALRILPLYYAYLLLLLVILPGLKLTSPEPLAAQLYLWTHLSNFLMAGRGWEGMPGHTTHLWSLAVEEQFYLLWPLIVFRADRRLLRRICMIVIVAAGAFRALDYVLAGNGVGGYVLLFGRMDALALGGLVAVQVREPGWLTRLQVLARPTLIVCAGMLAIVAMLTTTGESWFGPLSVRVQLLGYPAVDVLCASLLVRALDPGENLWVKSLKAPVLCSIGRYSYAMYVLHVPVRDLLRGRVFSQGLPAFGGSQVPFQLLLLIGGVAVSYGLGRISWRFLEGYFNSLKDRVAAPSGGAALPAGRA